MGVAKQEIPVKRTARYYQNGELSESTKVVWVVLHGYGMLAEFFIRRFESLANDETVILAPEGTHRFYLEGTSGRVGASWMTKDDRAVDIADNMSYLNDFMEMVYQRVSSTTRVILLGFSQGCPTAARYAIQAKVKPHAFVAYASDIPQDCLTEEHRTIWQDIAVCIAIGDNDPYIPKERIEPHLAQLKDAIPRMEYIPYSGDHRILKEPLKRIEQICLSA